jgi:hypothetical protein
MTHCTICDTLLPPTQPLSEDLCGVCRQEVRRVFANYDHEDTVTIEDLEKI